jgi:signal transduction histidine kinase
VFKENNDYQRQYQCLNIISKLLANISKSPEEAKYQSIKKSNAAIKASILDLPGGENLLISYGFQSMPETYTYVPSGNIKDRLESIEKARDDAEFQTLSKEEKEKKMLLKKTQEAYKAQLAKQEAERKRIAEKMEYDRKEKETDKPHDSIAQQPKFKPMSQENIKKFVPPCPPKG